MRKPRFVGAVAALLLAMGTRASLAAPGEVANVQWCPASKTCLQWDVEPSATQYRVYRGELSSFPCLLNPSVESCDDGTFVTTTTSGTITETPAPGSLFWFIVTATNGSGEGTPGMATPGQRLQNVSGVCLPSCGSSGALCSVDADCCSASCIAGTCQSACCQPADAFCTTDSDCCSGVCNGGLCLATCTTASQCPGIDTECRQRTCTAGACGFSFTAAGTQTTSQNPGDCRVNQCDGSGNVVNVADDSDLPPDDGNQCTDEVCVSGTPSHPNAPIGTACNQSGGTFCDGSGSCVAAPHVVSTNPTDGGVTAADTSISVTFDQAMNPTTLTAQTAAGACTGTVQVSLDGFVSCVAFSSSAPTMAGGNTIATLVPQPGLLVNRTYQIRVTTGAQNASAISLAATFTQATGFTTTSPNLCNGSIVISQIYGGGGLAGATYRNDFVELHNRGSVAVSVSGWSVQYASAAGTTWLTTAIPAGSTIQPGKYFLIQGGSQGANGVFLPTPDVTGITDMSSTTGKVALVANTTTLTGACPTGGAIVDFVGYGSSATCNEGGSNAAAPSTTTSTTRVQAGCADLNVNGTDFTAPAPVPRNSASSAVVCSCVAQNESDTAGEADYCAVVFPLTLTVPPAVTTGSIFGQVYEAGVTEPVGAASTVRAQLGYGPPTVNPQYQAGWSWSTASYNIQIGNNDEYQGSFIAPAAGSYRYAFRFSIDQGVSWTYCDASQGDFGSGSNAGLTFDLENLPVLTVTP